MVANKIVWAEGMFIRPQHFQQQDRYFDFATAAQLLGTHSYPWGVSELVLDQELLAVGRVVLKCARGMLPDGTPFSIPDQVAAPPALTVPLNTQQQTVYLALPLARQGAAEIGEAEAGKSRYLFKENEVLDNSAKETSAAKVLVAEPNFKLILEHEDLSQYTCLPVAKISEITSDHLIILDKDFVPPCLDIQAAPLLSDFMTELYTLLTHRREALLGRLGDIKRNFGALADFLLLQLINRYLPLLHHLRHKRLVHPETVYQWLMQMAGELATLVSEEKVVTVSTHYRHHRLAETFQPLYSTLRRLLSAVVEEAAFTLPLIENEYGTCSAQLSDHTLLDNAQFIVAVNANLAHEELIQRFPAQVKIGAVEQIPKLITAQLPGVKLEALPTVPPQIRYYANHSYFKLNFSAAEVQQLKQSAGLGIHVSGSFPGLHLELWVVRQ